MVLVVASCSKVEVPTISLTEESQSKMEELVAAGELSTAEYTIEKMVKADDCAWWKLGDRKILFACKAFLEGGIDMAEYDPTKTSVDEATKTIVLVLPKAKLLSMNMPADEIELKYQRVSALRHNFSAAERNNVLKQGEADIRADIPNLGILQDAEANATLFFSSMLKQMGFQPVTVKYE